MSFLPGILSDMLFKWELAANMIPSQLHSFQRQVIQVL